MSDSTSRDTLNTRRWICGISLLTIVAALGVERCPAADDRPVDLDRTMDARPAGIFSYRKVAASHHPAVLSGDWPTKINSEAQLFVNDELIRTMHGSRRTLH